MTFTYADDNAQLIYSPLRAAIGEYHRGQSRWYFLGWLWDGQVRDLAHAKQLTDEYMKGTPE